MSLDTSKFILQFQVLDLTTASGGGGGGITNHALLSNLDYASAGHTGFAATADFAAYLKKDGSVALTGPWNFGSQTISGTGDIHCNDLYTAGSTIYLGDDIEMSQPAAETLRFTSNARHLEVVPYASNFRERIIQPRGSSTQVVFKFPDGGTDAGVRFFNNSNVDCLRWKSNTSELVFDASFSQLETIGDLTLHFGNSQRSFFITDLADNEQHAFDYLGNADHHGNVTVSGYVGWDSVQLSEYNNVDLSINSDIYLAKSGGTTFYMPAGSDPMIFKVGGAGGDGDWRFQDSNSANQFRISGEGAVTAYNWISFAGPYGITTFNDDINIRMNDVAGNYKVSFWDDSPAEVASINSNGDIASSGTIGWLNVQLSEYNNADLAINADIRWTAVSPTLDASSQSNTVMYFKAAQRTKGTTGFQWHNSAGTQMLLLEDGGGAEYDLTLYGDLRFAGNYQIVAAGSNDLELRMADNAGTYKVSFQDSDEAEVAWIDSLGNASFTSTSGIGDMYCNDLIVSGDVRYVDTFWDDVRVPGLSVEGGTISGAELRPFGPNGSLQVYQFNPDNSSEVFFTVQIPHSYKEGTDVHPHVHWTPTTASGGDVRWRFRYAWANIYEDFPVYTTVNINATASGTAWNHQVNGFGAIDGTGKKISSMLVCRLMRYGDYGSDTYPDYASFLEFDFHFEVDSPGSREEYIS